MRRLLFTISMVSAPAALAAELVVLVDTATEMPMARFERYRLADGMARDIGLGLARHLQRTPRFLALPRKRIVRALEDGAADVLCNYVPEWLDGSFQWTQPFLPIAEVLIADRSVAAPGSVAELAGKPIGTVLGYRHPEMVELLGERFVRADGPTAESNLRKVAAGRIHYALTDKNFLAWRQKMGDPVLALHPPLMVKTYMGQCAVSAKGRVTLAEVDGAIGHMLREGEIGAIIARYK